jgi:hypothetical protein
MYFMSLLRMPVNVLNQWKIVVEFSLEWKWKEKKIHLVDWKIACTSLHKGNMGKGGGGGVLDL